MQFRVLHYRCPADLHLRSAHHLRLQVLDALGSRPIDRSILEAVAAWLKLPVLQRDVRKSKRLGRFEVTGVVQLLTQCLALAAETGRRYGGKRECLALLAIRCNHRANVDLP